MQLTVQPHRRQPTRLPRPWDFPGKNTGVGCHFLLQCMKVKSENEIAQFYSTLSDPMDCSLTRLLHPWDFPGKSTGVGCHRLLRQQHTTQPQKKNEILPLVTIRMDLEGIRSLKKQESFRKTSVSALLTMSKPLTVWITINCGKF